MSTSRGNQNYKSGSPITFFLSAYVIFDGFLAARNYPARRKLVRLHASPTISQISLGTFPVTRGASSHPPRCFWKPGDCMKFLCGEASAIALLIDLVQSHRLQRNPRALFSRIYSSESRIDNKTANSITNPFIIRDPLKRSERGEAGFARLGKASFLARAAETAYRGMPVGAATSAISLRTMRGMPLAECEAESSRKRFAKRQQFLLNNSPFYCDWREKEREGGSSRILTLSLSLSLSSAFPLSLVDPLSFSLLFFPRASDFCSVAR